MTTGLLTAAAYDAQALEPRRQALAAARSRAALIAAVAAVAALPEPPLDGTTASPPPPGEGYGLTAEEQAVRAYAWAMLHTPAYDLAAPADLFAWSADLTAALIPAAIRPPSFFRRTGEAARYADHLTAVFAAARRRFEADPAGAAPIIETLLTRANLLSAYFVDAPLRELAEHRAALTEGMLARYGRTLAHDFGPRPAERRRLKVGVFRNNYTMGTELAALNAHLLPYDRDKIELIAYALNATGSPGENTVRQAVDAFVILGEVSFGEAADRIRQDDLDVFIVGKNICGLNNFPWLLSAHRLARLQIADTLCPITTGLKSFDLFVNGAGNEPQTAQAHYTERLLILPTPINAYAFGDEAPAPRPVNLRQALKLRPEQAALASGANIYKLIPELLAVWARILAAAPETVLILYPFNPNWSLEYPQAAFAAHIKGYFASQGVAPERVTVLAPFASRGEVLGLLSEADLYLDSFPYSGAVSCVDPLLVGLPIIALEGHVARCRQSASLLRGLGLGELVAADAESYVEATLAAVRSPERREALRHKTRQAVPPNFPACFDLSTHFWAGVEQAFQETTAPST